MQENKCWHSGKRGAHNTSEGCYLEIAHVLSLATVTLIYLQGNVFCLVVLFLLKISLNVFLKEIKEGLGILGNKNKCHK